MDRISIDIFNSVVCVEDFRTIQRQGWMEKPQHMPPFWILEDGLFDIES